MAPWNAHCRVLGGIDATREQYVERSKERARAHQCRPDTRGGRLDDDGHAEMPELRSVSRNPRDRHLCRRGWRCRCGARLHRRF
jgi:hypothetical protein